MPRSATYAEIIDAEVDTLFPSILGKVRKVFPPSEGVNTYGPWTIQNINLEIDGKSIKCGLSNCDDATDLEGKWITITAGQKGQGIKAIDDEYQGRVTRKLWVTKAAAIELSDDQEPTQAPPPRPKPGAAVPTARAAATTNDHPFTQAGRRVVQLANLYIVSARAAIAAQDSLAEDDDRVDGEGFLQSIAQTIYIAAEHRQLDELMPSNRILESKFALAAKAEKPKAAEEPPPRKRIDPDAPLPAPDADDDVPY